MALPFAPDPPPQVQHALESCDMPPDVRAQVVAIWVERWHWFHSPLHGAGHCLDPEFWDDDGVHFNDPPPAPATRCLSF